MKGKVYLVGAGPGDPALLTRRAAELLAAADLVVYDRLVDPKTLALAPRRAQRMYVGKQADEKGEGQQVIHQVLIQSARRGKTVVRLKGGDPTLFGRISEELEALKRAGIPFEVVPGVSSVWAAATAAGIPLTDRRFSSSVVIVTGHEACLPASGAHRRGRPGRKRKKNWEALAQAADTLVILMGWAALPGIVRRLRRVRPGSTPIAVLRWVSTPAQEVVISTLARIEQDLKERPEFGPPVVVIVGEVVRLASRPAIRPLRGKTVIITRPTGDQQGLARRLMDLGAACRHLPTIAIRPKPLPAAEARVLVRRLPDYHWILFTSYHGVEALARVAGSRRRRLAGLIRGKICAIGPRTAQSVRQAGLNPDLLPDEFSKEGIERTFDRIPVRGKRILIPRSNLGMGDKLAAVLRRRGARVEEVTLYETVPVRIPPRRLRQALRGSDAVTFTSASTVRVFLESLQATGLSPRKALNGTQIVAIGPATGKALEAGGIRRYRMPDRSWTLDGLVEAVVEAVR